MTWVEHTGGLTFSWNVVGGTILYASGKCLIDLEWPLCGDFLMILSVPWLSCVRCCVTDKAVPWKESWLDVDEGLWSILSRFPVVKMSFRRTVGHTTPSFSNMLITRLASSVENWRTLSYETDKPCVNSMSMSARFLVLLWISRPRYRGRTGSLSRLCLVAVDCLVDFSRFLALKMVSCAMEETALFTCKI